MPPRWHWRLAVLLEWIIAIRMLTTLAVLALALPQAATGCQDAPPLQGEWKVVEFRTAKGAIKIEALAFALTIDGERYRFTHFEGSGTGKVAIDAKAGRLDMIGDKATLYCSYRLEGNTLTLGIWAGATDRQAAPSPDKGGMVFVFERAKKEKTQDAQKEATSACVRHTC
jgi:hypothetical protein